MARGLSACLAKLRVAAVRLASYAQCQPLCGEADSEQEKTGCRACDWVWAPQGHTAVHCKSECDVEVAVNARCQPLCGEADSEQEKTGCRACDWVWAPQGHTSVHCKSECDVEGAAYAQCQRLCGEAGVRVRDIGVMSYGVLNQGYGPFKACEVTGVMSYEVLNQGFSPFKACEVIGVMSYEYEVSNQGFGPFKACEVRICETRELYFLVSHSCCRCTTPFCRVC